jgi:alpha-tubulin suppressor-like RCC1 family protein
MYSSLSKRIGKRFFSARPPNGRVIARGQGVLGALGNGEKLSDWDKFQAVKGLASTDVRMVAAGWGHSATVTRDGQLYIFGRPFDFTTIMRINSIYKMSKTLARFVASSSNSMLFGSEPGYFPSPQLVGGMGEVKTVSCSAGLTLALTSTGDVYGFGVNRWSQCGVLSEKHSTHILRPTKISGLPPCRKVEAGLQHCLALTESGAVFGWGKAEKGQLALGADPKLIPQFTLPVQIASGSLAGGGGSSSSSSSSSSSGAIGGSSDEAVAAVAVTHISAGFAHSAAICSQGRLHVWGKGMGEEVSEKSYGSGTACS